MVHKVFMLFICFCSYFVRSEDKAPKLTIVVVIDQFAYHELQKLQPYFKGGIKFLHDNGVRYVNAFHPHGMPETGVGHTSIGTGTLAKEHGIIGNNWLDAQGNSITCDADNAPHAAVFSPTGLYNFGVSPKNIMVDTLSDQLIMNSYPHAKNIVFSLSLKSRSAVGMAGRLGKAVWFDAQSGAFTSSKVYFDELPQWVKDFNQEKNISELKDYTWDLTYPASSPAYNFSNTHDYEFSSVKKSWIGVKHEIDKKEHDPFLFFEKTPLANKLLLDCATACLKNTITNNPQERVVLWLSLSSLDLIGHVYGPNSLEALDMLYKIDTQLKDFIDKVYEAVPQEDVLFALTADHGIVPILEEVKKNGLTFAQRIDSKTLMSSVNEAIEKKHGISNALEHFRMPSFYCNKNILELSKSQRNTIMYDIKNILMNHPGIKYAWTFDELSWSPYACNVLPNYFKNQLYRNRTGHIICQVQPYNYIDIFTSGTAHGTPYDYDTHVPLIVYQKGKLFNKTIMETTYIPQLTVSLAEMLRVPRPSASTFNLLSGISYNGVKK